jgi:hypothetical protein
MKIGTVPPQIITFLDGSSRTSRSGTGDFGRAAQADDLSGANVGSAAGEDNRTWQRGNRLAGPDGGSIPRLDPQTLEALSKVGPQDDAAPSPKQRPLTDTETTGSTANDTSTPGKRVAIDFIHVELPNGVKFELRHTPGDGETGDQALQSLLKAAEELSRELAGIVAPIAKDADAETRRGDAATTAYAKQLSAYTARYEREGPVVTA